MTNNDYLLVYFVLNATCHPTTQGPHICTPPTLLIFSSFDAVIVILYMKQCVINLVFLLVIQETQERFPKLGQMEPWEDLGSGEIDEGSTTDCDDEDGCQASGDGQDKTCK